MNRRSLAVLGALVAAASPAHAVSTAREIGPGSLELLGELALPAGTVFEGEPVGGLSGLVWDEAERSFLALSDDRGERGAVRYYRLRLDLGAVGGAAGGVTIVERVPLRGADGAAYAVGRIDPEGFARGARGELYFSSEGVARDGLAPFVARLESDGREAYRFALPARVAPDGTGRRGVRDNLGFESLAVSADGSTLVAGLENALAGEGAAADVGVASPARLLAWEVADPARPPREYAYEVGPVTQPLPRPDIYRVNGLVDLVALSDDRLWALEREFAYGGENRLLLYEVRLTPPLAAAREGRVGTTEKRLLLDFADLGIPLDNFEGMTFGPRLADGRRSFVVVSDDNFSPLAQATRFLVFAADEAPLAIAAIQGGGHRSPLDGRWAVGLEGVVTAIDGSGRVPGFFVESPAPDADPATSEGLRVEWSAAKRLEIGDRVRMHGRIRERVPGPGQLSVTTLAASAVERAGRDAELPPAPWLGSELRIPDLVDDDGLGAFEPAHDAIDLWESLEGMRVVADGRRVTGATTGYDELVLALDQRAGEAASRAEGYLLTPAGPRRDRVLVSGRLIGGLPQVAVGSLLARPAEGVVDYSFSNYKLLATRPLAVGTTSTACDARTSLWPDPGRLRVATFNVENLSLADSKRRFDRLAEAVVTRLGSPEVLALQEVQDDTGRQGGDGVVTARGTLDRLVAAIAAAGGPRYEWTQIDPEPDREGGVPGGNIRVALLYAPARAALRRRGDPGPREAARIVSSAGRIGFEPNPGRVAPLSAAFTLSAGEGVRRSLAVELEIAGAPWFFVVNHWSSKFDDGRDYGAAQPPDRPTGAKRLAQAETVHSFAAELVAADPAARLVVLGDLNDLPWSPPIARVSQPPLTDLTARVPTASRYSYNFEGSAQLIDYVLASPALARDAEVEIVHLNSDCPDSRRTSDHDAVVASFSLTGR